MIIHFEKNAKKHRANITEGALYPALHKLEAEGVLSSELCEVDDRIRKYYKLTEKGINESTNKLAELAEFALAKNRNSLSIKLYFSKNICYNL